eukprot:297743-Amphidinium_carterae.1
MWEPLQPRTSPGLISFVGFAASCLDVSMALEDLDFWVHVGDYIYEHAGNASYNGEARASAEPIWETVDLQDHPTPSGSLHATRSVSGG